MVHLECGHSARTAGNEYEPTECIDCDLYQMPTMVHPRRRTAVFDHETVPNGLRREHKTSVWARLIVLEGSVHFRDSVGEWSVTGTTLRSLVIVPDRPHMIRFDPGAKFYVQFYDLTSLPDTTAGAVSYTHLTLPTKRIV